jgi:hypothetical protein
MLSRALLLLVTLFWLTMNFLLWRAEYGARAVMGTSLPAGLVWQKMLTAPDSSSLTVMHRNVKVGFCHWLTSVGADLSRLKVEDTPPEGMVGRVAGYRIQIEGNLAALDSAHRARFDCSLKLATNQAWQELTLRLNLRPALWEIHSLAAEQTLRVRGEDEDGKFERTFKFSELGDPQGLIHELGGPWTETVLTVLGGLGLPGESVRASKLSLGLKWEARNDWLKIDMTWSFL